MEKHAYLIMAHNEFHMLKKLLTELDDERNDIFIHIDGKADRVDENDLKSVVKKSKVTMIPRMKVYWGHLSIVRCELRLLDAALEGHYKYYHLLSGVDFPIKTQDEIHSFFNEHDNEFVSYHTDGANGDYYYYKIKYYFPLIKFVGRGNFEDIGKLKKRILKRLGKWQEELLVFQEKKGIDRCRNDKKITYYKGDQWFSITDSFARFIVSNKKDIIKRYRMTNGPDEFFVPTLVMNSKFAGRVVNTSLREIDWDRGQPYEYTLEDLKMLECSDNFFARKLSYDKNPELVDALIEFLHGKNCVK